jgi:hypothetical protein
MRSKPSYVDFEPATYAWSPDIDYRRHPELYRIGRGQQGVLTCQPYKGELCPHWRFKTPEIALESAQKIYAMFLSYVKNKDFVGADMAKKYLHMGYTRARRYANHASGRKWAKAEAGKFYREKRIRERTKKRKVLKFFTRFGSGQERIPTI